LIESIEPDAEIVEAQMAVVRRRLDDLESGRLQPFPCPEGLRKVREALLKQSQE